MKKRSYYNVLVVILVLLFSINLNGQTIITIDAYSNTIKRTSIKTAKKYRKKHLTPATKSALVQDYLDKIYDKTFTIDSTTHLEVFKKPIRVDDYLIFEIINLDKRGTADSLNVTYSFTNSTDKEYSDFFKSIINKPLENYDKNKEDKKNEEITTEAKTKPEKLTNKQILETAAAVADSISAFDLMEKLAAANDSINQIVLAKKDADSLKLDEMVLEEVFKTSDSEKLIEFISEVLGVSLDMNIIQREFKKLNSTTDDEKGESDDSSTTDSENEDRQESSTTETFGESKDSNIIDFIFLPIQIENKDILNFYVDGFKEGSRVYSRPYRMYTKGGFKVDFSAGFMGSFVKDYSYVLNPANDTTYTTPTPNPDSIKNIVVQNQIEKVNDGDFYIGAGVMAHFHNRCAPRLGVAISTGFMFREDSRVNYLLGGSLLLGLEQRLIISGGLAFGQAKRVAQPYSEGQVVPASVTVVPTQDTWQAGMFLGVTYKL